jgi:3-oxoacyl-[acyl-carrier protein] reductase
MRLKDRVAIVTGGAQGIGKAYAAGFADEGAKLVIADIDLEAARATAETLKERGAEVLATGTDVSSAEDTQEMVRKTVERFDRVDILVNNAAVFGRVRISKVPFYELDFNEWDRVMAVNVKGSFLCSRAVFPYMKAQGRGKIINISSGQFYAAAITYAHYIASKGAVIGLTRALARELGEYNINVNCIAPGSTFSEDSTDGAAFERRQRAISSQALKRMEYPEDLVGTAIFLACSDSDFITGQTIMVNGGGLML